MKLSGQETTELGLVVIKVSGPYNMPPRLDPWHYDWGDELQPLVSAGQITHSGFFIVVDFLYDHRLTVTALPAVLAAIDAEDPLTLELTESDGTSGVYDVDFHGTSGHEKAGSFERFTASFYVRVPEFNATIPGTSGVLSDYSIAGRNASLFSLVMGRMYEYNSIPALKASKETVYASSPKYLQDRFFKQVEINCWVVGTSSENAFVNLEKFKALLASPGLKELRHNGKTMDVFLSEGFSASKIGRAAFKFDLTLNVI